MPGTTDCNALPAQEYGPNNLASDWETRPKRIPAVAKVVEISSVESAAARLPESETKPDDS